MTQLHIVQSISKSEGGLGLAALQIAASVASAQLNAAIFVLKRADDEFEIDQTNSFLKIYGRSGGSLLNNMADLLKLIREGIYEVIHIHGTWTPLLAYTAVLAVAFNRKLLLSPHGSLEPWALKHKNLKKRVALALYQNWVLRKSSVIFATADQELESIRALGLTNPVAVIPLGIDAPPAHFRRTPLTTPKNILFLSRIHPKKGIPMLIDSWAIVRQNGWHVIVAGSADGNYVSELQEAVATRGLTSDFSFPGLMLDAEKERLFAEAQFFILPTHSENFGIAVGEALARGVPVITTTGAPWQDIASNGCGWWVEPDVESIAGALRAAMENDLESLREMGERGKQLIRDKYSWEAIGASYIAVHKWVGRQDAGPPSFLNFAHAKVGQEEKS